MAEAPASKSGDNTKFVVLENGERIRVPNYVEFELVQPIDESKVNVDNCLPSAWTNSANLGAVIDGKRYQVPTDWGTEAVSFDKDQAPLEYGTASYGDIWKPEMNL